ncbi:MAG TPA: ABC transporter permease [Myxococcota bacterium]|nr:ABC transporter permease [Myxococcota bacterium]HQK51346.1 ABC transporter permease [Myxococcota bacterium]
MPVELLLAVRFLREGRFQSLLILAGVSVGVGVIIFLSALISGLQATLINRTLGSQPHLVVQAPKEGARRLRTEEGEFVAAQVQRSATRRQSIPEWQPLVQALEMTDGVVAVSPVAAGAAFVARGEVNKAVALRGVDPDRFDRIVRVRDRLRAGQFRLQGDEAAIGVELAEDLGVGVGDRVRMTTEGGVTEVFTVSGIFDLGAKDVNQRWALVSLRRAQSLLDLGTDVTSLEVRVREIFQAEDLARRIASRTGMQVDPWTRINAELLIGLRSQNASSYMIQFFVVLAVALGIASVLVVSVVQKSREIGILKTIGVSTRQAQAVFLIQGGLVGLVGSLIGSGLGVTLSVLFQGMARNPDGSPTFPVDLSWQRFAVATLMATVVGLVSAVAPARRAALLDPAEVIRNG